MILAILLLLFMSAFFSCSETVLITLNKFQIRKLSKKKKYSSLKQWIYKPSKFLTGILIGNNIANIAFGTLFTAWVLKYAAKMDINLEIASLIAFIIISVIMLFFGEIVPKNIGKSKSLVLIKIIISPLNLFVFLFSPFISLVGFLEKIIVTRKTKSPEKITKNEFQSFISKMKEDGILNKDIEGMIYSFLDLKNTTVSEVMTSRDNIAAYNINSSKTIYNQIIRGLSKSRIPVYEDTIDQIIGVFYIKDFLAHNFTDLNLDIKSKLRKPLFVDSKLKTSNLFRILKQTRIHLAIVTTGKEVVGLVTIEDILEELTGEILDEYDVNKNSEDAHKRDI